MAMNVKFLQGSSTNFNKITTKEANTFYYVTDKKALYLGANLIGDGVSTEAFEALARRVKTLEDWKALLATETGKTSASTTSIPDLIAVTVKTKDGAVSGVSVDDSALRSLISSYVTNVTFNTYKQEQDSRDDGQDSKIAALEETVEGIVNVGGEANLVDDVQVNGTSIVAGKVANIVVDGNYSNINKIATMSTVLAGVDAAKGYTNAEITGLEFALSDDGKTLSLKNKAGTAVATLDTSDFVVDGMLSSVVADQTNNKLTFTWNTDSGIKETVIELSSIADIYTGSTNANEVNVTVSNANVISATVGANVKADIAKGVEAQGWGNHAEAGYVVESSSTFAQKVDKVAGATVDNIVVFSTASGSQKDSGKSLSDFATAAQGSTADSALQEVTIAGKKLTKTNNTISATEISEAINLTGGADSFAAKIGEAKGIAEAAQLAANNVGSNLSYNYKTWTDTQTAIQGATTNTVKDCVDAINKMNNVVDENGQVVAQTIGTVENIVNQLTWGTF